MTARAAEFGSILARLRQEQGFPNPFSFYNKRGGRAALGLSFPNYLRLERGKSLPQPQRLKALLDALGLRRGSPGAAELARGYLKAVLGSEELLELLAAPAEKDPAPYSWTLAESAGRQAISQRAVQLSLEQYTVLCRDLAAYACHAYLANTLAWVSKKELAGALGLSAKEAERALKALKSAGLAELDGTRVRSPLAGKFVTPPAPTPALAAVFAALQKHRERLCAQGGRLLHAPYLVLRAPKRKMESYLQHLSDVVNLSAIYGDVKPGPDSEMYLVEGRVTRLFK